MVSIKKRGRPRMSRASLPLLGDDVMNAGAIFAFLKEEAYIQFMAEELTEDNPASKYPNNTPAYVKLL